MGSRFEVHIVSHYRPSRAEQLGIVLDSMLGWPDCVIDVVISSNVDTYQSSGFLAPYVAVFEASGHRLRLNVVGELDNPRMLTWEHKRFLEPWLQTAASEHDYFMWIEDDIRITDRNIEYFVRTLQTLKPHRLIPGFIRYETKGEEVRVVDIMETEFIDQRSVIIDGRVFHACLNPYWAGSILDRDLAIEYLESRSFGPETSTFVPWGVQERAAMGLTWEDPRPDLGTRIVIPLVRGLPDDACLVWHAANNYSAENHPLIASLTVQRAFRRTPLPGRAERVARHVVGRVRGALGRVRRALTRR